MKNKDRIGQIAMHPGNENACPVVVYVLGLNGLGMLALQELNSGTLSMASPERDTLLDFNFNEYEILRASWYVDHHEQSKQRWAKSRDRLIKSQES